MDQGSHHPPLFSFPAYLHDQAVALEVFTAEAWHALPPARRPDPDRVFVTAAGDAYLQIIRPACGGEAAPRAS